MPAQTIAAVVRKNAPAMRACVERALKKQPDLAFVPDFRFTIGPKGTVIAASAKGAPTSIQACFVTAMKKMVFPPPADGGTIEVAYPINQVGIPKVTLGDASPDIGGISKEVVRRVVKTSIMDIGACFEAHSRDDLSAQVMVDFTVGPDGRVTSALGQGGKPDLNDCLAKLFGKMLFPAPTGGGSVKVSYPVHIIAAGQ